MDNWLQFHTPVYQQSIKAGESRMVVVGAECRQLPAPAGFPLVNYHKEKVTVVATRDRVTYPDDEGLVEVLLPFPYFLGEKAVFRAVIPYWCLV